MTEEIIIAIIGASAVIIAAIITAIAKRSGGSGEGKGEPEKTSEPLEIPETPRVKSNPFDLDPKTQESDEDFFEALATRLIETRNPNDVEIREIKK